MFMSVKWTGEKFLKESKLDKEEEGSSVNVSRSTQDYSLEARLWIRDGLVSATVKYDTHDRHDPKRHRHR